VDGGTLFNFGISLIKVRDMDRTATLRHFNRTYTQRLGALDESFLGLGMPLAAARLLYEIGLEGATARSLRDRLGLDSGYLTRLLRSLQDRELVTVHPDLDDRRLRRATLTPQGRSTYRRLEDRSEELAKRILEPLSNRQRDRLTEALRTADLLIRAATVQLREVHPQSPVALAAVDRYFAELDRRFSEGFDSTTAHAADVATMGTGASAFVVAISDGLPVGCGSISQLSPTIGEIKRMWVAGEWRGAGLGSRLLRHLESNGAQLGFRTIRLDTNKSLTEAMALYERSGYRRIERYNDNPYAHAWFEKDITAQST
jgi:DNA-binding MarR family transcriptional regulator/GNAT superfamily N-acetyltransferase